MGHGKSRIQHNGKPDKYDSTVLYGLEAGKYRLALKTPKDQIINVEYTRDKSKEKGSL